MRTIQTTFQGTVPKLDAKLLPDPNGQVATGIDVTSGALRGLRAPTTADDTSLSDPTSGSKYLSLFRYDWMIGTYDTRHWMVWETDVNVCPGPLADDTYKRIYMSGASANAGLPPQLRYVYKYPSLNYAEYQAVLGIPSPTTAPVIATTAQQASSWSRVWGYWWEETDGTRSDMNMFALRRPALNNIGALVWKPYADAYTFEATLATDNIYPFPSTPVNVYYQLPASSLVKLIQRTTLADFLANDNSWYWGPTTTAGGGNTLYIRGTAAVGSPDTYAYNSFLAEIPSNQSMDSFCNLTETTAGQVYSLESSSIPIKVLATSSAKFIMRLQAYTNTGAMLGQLYPDISAWGAESDLYINGAKATAVQTNSGNRVFTLSYNTQSSQYYTSNRTYIYTRISDMGEESAPSDPSNEMSVAPNLSVIISGMTFTQPDPTGYTGVAPNNIAYVPIAELRIYRTVTSSAGTGYQYVGSLYKLYSLTKQYYVGDMVYTDVTPGGGKPAGWYICSQNSLGDDGITGGTLDVGDFWEYSESAALEPVSFTDSITDAEVGEAIATIGWTPPEPTWQCMVSMPGAFLAMHDGDKTVYFSEPNYPHAWPIKYGVTLDYKIKGMAVSGNTLVVGTEQNPYLITVTDPANVTVSKLAAQQPCTSKRSMLESGGAVFYASPDGLVSIGGAVVTIETEAYLTKAQWWALQTDSARSTDSTLGYHPEETMVTVYDDVIYVFCASGNFTFQSKNFARGIVNVALDPSAIWLSGKDDALYYIVDLPNDSGCNWRKTIWNWMDSETSWQGLIWTSKNITAANYDVPAVFRVRSNVYPSGQMVGIISGKDITNVIAFPITSGLPIRLADYGTLVADEYFSFTIYVWPCTTTQTVVTEVLIISRETQEFDGTAVTINALETPQLTWCGIKTQFPRVGTFSSAKICAQKYPTGGILADFYADDVKVLSNVPFTSDNALRLNDFVDYDVYPNGLPDGITWEINIKTNEILYDLFAAADVPTPSQGVIKFTRQSAQLPILRAMSILADKPISFTAGKVVASSYPINGVKFTLYDHANPRPGYHVFQKIVTDDKVFRIPILRKLKRWELDVEAVDIEITEITLTNSIFSL